MPTTLLVSHSITLKQERRVEVMKDCLGLCVSVVLSLASRSRGEGQGSLGGITLWLLDTGIPHHQEGGGAPNREYQN